MRDIGDVHAQLPAVVVKAGAARVLRDGLPAASLRLGREVAERAGVLRVGDGRETPDDGGGGPSGARRRGLGDLRPTGVPAESEPGGEDGGGALPQLVTGAAAGNASNTAVAGSALPVVVWKATAPVVAPTGIAATSCATRRARCSRAWT